MVGGDGIVFEVINGLFERWDWSETVKNIPVGVIPGGSGNGLARSIAYHCGEPYIPSTLPSALAAIKSKVAPMDLVRVETKSQILFSFLSVGWGFLSDVDIESERLRILGGQRFNVWSLARLIGLRSYRGKIWYLPASCSFNIPKDIELSPINTGSNPDISVNTHATRQRLDSWYSAASRRTAFFSAAESSYQSTTDNETGDPANKEKPRMYGPASQLPCLNATLTPPWVCIDGSFLMVHASYQSHLGEDVLFVPDAKLNDGTIWLLVIHTGTTRSQLLQFLLRLSSGSHLNCISKRSRIQLLPVRAFRIEPDPKEQGYVTVDGELVEYGPIQAEIFPELGRIMVP
ncbi:hypothetical protein HHI36_018586 [Cryptolaemus montrouzieri]|uniref:DAGKc domain-containing protein n=1 Tax=Cryptolaemus montrouzieri TaxID=559131 RepID=A0ABD2P175_9CUCU